MTESMDEPWICAVAEESRQVLFNSLMQRGLVIEPGGLASDQSLTMCQSCRGKGKRPSAWDGR